MMGIKTLIDDAVGIQGFTGVSFLKFFLIPYFHEYSLLVRETTQSQPIQIFHCIFLTL